MLPFIHVFGRDIPAYGLCILLGALIGVSFAMFLPAKKTISKEDLLFASCFAGIGVFVGAKLLYFFAVIPLLVDKWSLLVQNPSLIMGMLTGGFVFYGGVIGGLLGIVLYTRKFKIDLIDTVDILTPSFPLIHGFGRIGCFLAGCCYGIPMAPPHGLLFEKSPVAPHDIHLFPVQLLEASINLLLFAFLFVYARKTKVKGNTFLMYIFLYAVERFILEYFRFDSDRGFFLLFSTSQWISIAMVLACIIIFLRRVFFKKNQNISKSKP